ncbi:hypothetical protein Scep_019603 [Stephania cephalantha]|uniref:FACT complex subunit n=1 Tax=Stephania cephalantha TaxID=152367 RepID=A0AAP0IAZ0_9MAGN
MTIFFKDFKKKVCQINSIPSTSVDGIKEWLSTINLKHYESKPTLKWQFVLKTITDDPKKFVKDGGWDFLNADASDSDFENSEDSDQKYEPSNDSFESDSDDEDDDIDSLEESDDNEDSEEDLEEEKGNTWKELEREQLMQTGRTMTRLTVTMIRREG